MNIDKNIKNSFENPVIFSCVFEGFQRNLDSEIFFVFSV